MAQIPRLPAEIQAVTDTSLATSPASPQSTTPSTTPQSTSPSTPNYLNEARQRFYATMAERERLIGERKALADSLMQTQQQRTDKALAIANLGTEVGIENIVRERQFQEGKKARLQDLENMYAQHAAKYGMALNKQAIEILKEFSNINAPTLTSIMTGYEMARTSAMENDAKRLENFTKLNESYNAIQKELLASNQREAELRQQLRINEEQAELDMLDYKIKSKTEELNNILTQNKELANAWEGWGRIEVAAAQNKNTNEANSFSMKDLPPTEGGGTGKSALTAKEIAIKLGDADSRISGSALVLPEEFTSAYEQNLATYVNGTGSSLEKVLKDPNALKKVYNFTFDDFLKNKKIVPVEGSDNKFFKFNVGGEEGKGTEEKGKSGETVKRGEKDQIFSEFGLILSSPESDINLDTPIGTPSKEDDPNLARWFASKLPSDYNKYVTLHKLVRDNKEPSIKDQNRFWNENEETRLTMFRELAEEGRKLKEAGTLPSLVDIQDVPEEIQAIPLPQEDRLSKDTLEDFQSSLNAGD